MDHALNLNSPSLWTRAPVHDAPERWLWVPVRVPWSNALGLVYGHADGTDELDLQVMRYAPQGYAIGSQFLARLLTPLSCSDLTEADIRTLVQLEQAARQIPRFLSCVVA